MGSIQLKVAPEVLNAKAQDITEQISGISDSWKEMCRIIHKSKTYWEGEASACHRKAFEGNKKDVERLLRRLKGHPKELLTMAGIYVQAEAEAEKLALSLPDNIIE